MVTRFLRIIIFFDLPVSTAQQRSAYSKFRNRLIKEGYLMMQESVYTKLAINRQTMELELNRLKTFIPKNGLIQALTVTEKQFARIQTVLGEEVYHAEINNTSRLVIL